MNNTKIILAIFVIAVTFLIFKAIGRQSSNDYDPASLEETEMERIQRKTKVVSIPYQGHEYLLIYYQPGHESGVVHSESCPCKGAPDIADSKSEPEMKKIGALQVVTLPNLPVTYKSITNESH